MSQIVRAPSLAASPPAAGSFFSGSVPRSTKEPIRSARAIFALMLRARGAVCFALLGGCAGSRPAPHAAPSVCSVALPVWPNARDNYDRAATIDVLTAIESVIRDAPSAAFQTVANRLDTLFKKPAGTAFVSSWSAELATRLRQLVCAELQGQIATDVANHRYITIISDLEDERAVIVDEMRRGEH